MEERIRESSIKETGRGEGVGQWGGKQEHCDEKCALVKGVVYFMTEIQ